MLLSHALLTMRPPFNRSNSEGNPHSKHHASLKQCEFCEQSRGAVVVVVVVVVGGGGGGAGGGAAVDVKYSVGHEITLMTEPRKAIFFDLGGTKEISKC